MIEAASRTISTSISPRKADRRREQRYSVKEGTFVVNSPNMGQLTDISMSGLAFTYFDWEEWPDSFQEMDIFQANGGGYCLHNLPGDTVSDSAANSYMQDLSHNGQRRRSVHFRELSPFQVEELLSFIQTHATGLK